MLIGCGCGGLLLLLLLLLVNEVDCVDDEFVVDVLDAVDVEGVETSIEKFNKDLNFLSKTKILLNLIYIYFYLFWFTKIRR